MRSNAKYYKIKIVKKFLTITNQARVNLLNELVVNATDPILYKRRLRMLEHLSQYECQILEKIRDFDTDDVQDFNVASQNILTNLQLILNKSA